MPKASVELGSFDESLRDRKHAALYRYWNRKRAGRRAPARTDIDPIEMRPMLPQVGLIDVCEGGERFRYRLLGTALTAIFGQDMTGCYLDETIGGEYGTYLENLYRRCAGNLAPVYAESEFGFQDDDRSLWTARLLLPLSSDGSEADMILFMNCFRPGSAASRGLAFSVEQVVGVRAGRIIEQPPA